MKFKNPLRRKKEDTELLSVELESTKSSRTPIDEASVMGIGYGDNYVNRIIQKTGLTTAEMWDCYIKDEWVRACVDKIIKEVVKYKVTVVPKESTDQIPSETQAHIDEVKALLDNPNGKVESFDNIRRKYLKDILVYDAGAMEIVYAHSSEETITAMLKSKGKELFKLMLSKKLELDEKKKEELNKKINNFTEEIRDLRKQLKAIKQTPNKPVELYDVAGVNIKVNVDKNGNFKENEPAYYFFKNSSSRKPDAQFAKNELIYMIANPTAGSVYGISPIETLYDTVQADIQAALLNRRRLDNDGMISGVLSFPGMSAKKLQRNQMFWKQQARKKGARLVLTSSKDVTFTKVVESHQEMQFMEYQKWTLDKIMAVYGMQPIVLGVITPNTGKLNSEQQRQQFKSDAISPLLALESHHLTDVLIQQGFGYDDIKISYIEPKEETSPKDNVDKAERMGKLGVITINEAREMIGLPRLEEGGDDLIMVRQLKSISEDIAKSEHQGKLAEIKQRIDELLAPTEPTKEEIEE